MIRFSIEEPRIPRALEGEPIQQWVQPDGTKWAACYRVDSVYLVRFPHYADFEIDLDAKQVKSFPLESTNKQTIEHLYQNHVLPITQGGLGQLVFHGSAIEIGSEALLFLGESGRGKSTLALSFATNGLRFLADDGLVIANENGKYHVLPNHPAIRVWDDSREKIVSGAVTEWPKLPINSKNKLGAGKAIPHCDAPRTIKHAYFLGTGEAKEVSIQPLSKHNAIMKWIVHSFLLDVEHEEFLAEHFEKASEMIRHVPSFLLDFPREFNKTDTVQRAILEHADFRS